MQGNPSTEIWRDTESRNADRPFSDLEIKAMETAEQARAAAAAAAEVGCRYLVHPFRLLWIKALFNVETEKK